MAVAEITNIVIEKGTDFEATFNLFEPDQSIAVLAGLTVLEDTIEIKSIENRLLLFDASVPHHSTTCTDDKCRVNVNFNFF